MVAERGPHEFTALRIFLARAMPPPIPRESYIAAFGNLKRLLATAAEFQDPKEVLVVAFKAIEALATIVEQIVLSVNAVEDKVGTWEPAALRSSGQSSLSESKCVGNLKSLGSDKVEFKSWKDKREKKASRSREQERGRSREKEKDGEREKEKEKEKGGDEEKDKEKAKEQLISKVNEMMKERDEMLENETRKAAEREEEHERKRK